MKKISFFLSILSVLSMALFQSSCKGGGNKNIGANDTLALVSLYQFAKAEPISIEKATGLASTLLSNEFNKELLQTDEQEKVISYSSKEGGSYFNQNTSNGDWTFSRNIDRYYSDYNPKIPDQKQAQSIAEQFLKTNNLMPANSKEVHLVHSGGVQGVAVNSQSVKDLLRTFTYARVLDNLPVTGPGSRIVVKVGDNGEVVAATYRWHVLAAEKTTLKLSEIKSEKEASEEALKIVAEQFGSSASATLNRIQLAYFDQGLSYIQPVYSAELSVTMLVDGKEKVTMPYLCIIEAMRQSPEALTIRLMDAKAKELAGIQKESSIPEEYKKKQETDD